jgi:chlorophyllide a reductase subunit Y
MTAFFDGVGSGETAGIWERKPEPRPVKAPLKAKRVAANAMPADGGKV